MGLPPAKDFCAFGRVALAARLLQCGLSFVQASRSLGISDPQTLRDEWKRITDGRVGGALEDILREFVVGRLGGDERDFTPNSEVARNPS